MTTHDLKCSPRWFEEVWLGRKTAELRFNDRNYQVGDSLRMREYIDNDMDDTPYTGRVIQAEITHIVTADDGPFLSTGYVMLSLGTILRLDQR